MRDSCPDVWAANELTSLGECEAKLAALPLAEGEELYTDGNTCASSRAHLTAPLALSQPLSALCGTQCRDPNRSAAHVNIARAQVIVP